MNDSNDKLSRRQIIGTAAAFCASACFARSAETKGTRMPWTRRGIKGSEENFRFAVVADRTNSAREGVFENDY